MIIGYLAFAMIANRLGLTNTEPSLSSNIFLKKINITI